MFMLKKTNKQSHAFGVKSVLGEGKDVYQNLAIDL